MIAGSTPVIFFEGAVSNLPSFSIIFRFKRAAPLPSAAAALSGKRGVRVLYGDDDGRHQN